MEDFYLRPIIAVTQMQLCIDRHEEKFGTIFTYVAQGPGIRLAHYYLQESK